MKKMILPISAGLAMLTLCGCAIIPDVPPSPTPTPPLPPSGYEPQPGDDKLQRGQVYLDLENSNVILGESLPVQVSVILIGNLPNPCHQLRVAVAQPNDQKEVHLEAYSVFDPGAICISVLKPFSATIPLGTYSMGHFSVFVNGQLIGEFEA